MKNEEETKDWIADKLKKPIEAIEFFFRCKYGLWSKQREAVKSVLIDHNKITAIRSCHASGKSFILARIALLFLLRNPDSIVITTAPCYDEKTEILTDNGWKYFKNLSSKDKVAQLKEGKSLEFVKPERIIKTYYKGKMVGFKSQLLDFLVTPNHRCYTKLKLGGRNGYEGKWQVKEAKDIFNREGWRFKRDSDWIGKERSLDKMEFYGFWFADGHSEFNPKSRKYRVCLTQKNYIDYVDNLLERNKDWLPKWHKYKGKNGICNWEIYNKELAKEFVVYGKAITKRIPVWIKESSKESIKKFLYGFWKGDGHMDKNGSTRLFTSSKGLADDLQELCVKAGYVVNLDSRSPEGSWGKHTKYVIGFWNKRGKEVQSYKKHWYQKDYSGFVYCVTVPSGVVLVRRNGKYHWNGNSWTQVKEILWRELRGAYVKMESIFPRATGGKLLATSLELSENWYAIGLATRKESDASEVAERMLGFHSKTGRTLVVVDEGSGVKEEIFGSIDGILASEGSQLLVGGNPYRTSGSFAKLFSTKGVYKIHIQDTDIPNVRYNKIIIPGLMSPSYPEEMARKYGLNSNLYLIKVKGDFPKSEKDTLIPVDDVERAFNRTVEAEGRKRLGVDPARFGDDKIAFVVRQGKKVIRKETYAKEDLMQTVGRTVNIMDEEGIEPEDVFVDVIGIGAGVVDRLHEKEYTKNGTVVGRYDVNGIAVGGTAEDTERFYNIRAEAYWKVRDWIKEADLPKDDDFYEVANMKYKFSSEKKGQILIESKKDMKKRGLPSPDVADALMLTFAGSSISHFIEQHQGGEEKPLTAGLLTAEF